MNQSERPLISIAPQAQTRLPDYLKTRAQVAVRMVADTATWKALGETVAALLQAAGIEVATTLFAEQNLAADARSVLRLLADETGGRLLIAVGSGTITDLVRFVAHRTGRGFVALPTAPSVDAYASVVAPLVVDGIKRTLQACAPLAIFADLETLCRAPRPMIAAGFGDMLGKFSAVADWRLGALLWGESYDEDIAQRSLAAARRCGEAAAEIGRADGAGVARLMEGLVESGLCMAEAGHSRPASGAEHQYSHFWEMRLLRQGRAPVLHGLKVGVGSLLIAGIWDRLRSMGREEARSLFAAARIPSRDEERSAIRRAYGQDAAEIEAGQQRFLGLTSADRAALIDRILANWDEIQVIARDVPTAATTEALLKTAHCPTMPEELGLGSEEIGLAITSAHYLRDRFTVRKLSLFLGE